jgi:DNA-binding YbaB/EbfC family protein
MFDKMKQLYDMQKQAKQMQKSVEALKIETSAAGGDVKVVMNGAFKVEFISIADKLLAPAQKDSLVDHLKRALNEAAEEAAKKSAEQTMALMKGMNLKIPGF